MSKPTLADVMELSIPERILLVEDIWDSIASCAEAFPNIAEHQRVERRLEDYHQNPVDDSSWEDARKRITGKTR